MFHLQLTVQQALTLKLTQALELVGGSTESIFPEVEAFLQASSDHQNALDWVASRKKADRYRSVVDFLFCELYPEHRGACFRFYLSGDQPFRELITMAQRSMYAWEMLQALRIAYGAFCDKRRLSWSAFRSEVKKVCAAG